MVLIALKDEEGKLTFLVNPDLRNMVQPEDLAYLEELLRDFQERTELHPEALFKQLSSLGVGPLVTQDAGSSIADRPALLELCSRFVQF